ncbi:MAG: SMP-30/gluconolactonase/LRE family protein [Acidimicrobiia bacterium]
MALGMLNGYVWGPINPEDVVPIPGTTWVVASGMLGPTAPLGRLYIIDRHDLSCSELFPYGGRFEPDIDRFGDCRVLDPATFEPHGIDVTVRSDGVVEVYVVSHGGGEFVDVFEVDLGSLRPTATWIGSAAMPEFTFGNDVAASGDGAFFVSSTSDTEGGAEVGLARMAAGEETGKVVEWQLGRGFTTVPGSAICSANGVAVSADRQWLYIAGWSSRCVRKVSLTKDPIEITTVATDIMVDNLTWTPDGDLLAAGAYDTSMEEFLAGHYGTGHRLGLPSRVLRIDPDTLAIETIIDYGPETYGVATTGVQVGAEIWVGAARDRGIARFTVT